MRSKFLVRSVGALLAIVVGCGDDDGGSDSGIFPDASHDASPPEDATADASTDAPPDPDAGTDAGVDAFVPPARHGVVVRLVGDGIGRVVSDAGHDCNGAPGDLCYLEVEHDTLIHFEASGDAGSSFVSWSVTECGAALGCDLRIDDDVVVEARFELGTENLTLNVNEGGHVDVAPLGVTCGAGTTCTYERPHGSTVTLVAVADGDHRHMGWTDDCAATTGAICTVSLEASRTVGAIFALRTDSLSVVRAGTGSGRIVSTPAGIDCPDTCEQSLTRGTSVALAATADEGSDFQGWSGACTGSGACAVSIDGPTFVVASFARRTYDVVVSRTGDGDARVLADVGAIDCGSTCRDRVSHGTSVTFTVSPEPSSTIVSWGGACASAGSSPTCTVVVTADTNVSVNVARRRFDVAIVREGTGVGSVASSPAGISCGSDCTENVSYGAALSLTATPAASSTFSGWAGACTGTGVCELVVTAPTEVRASFAIRTYVTTVAAAAVRGGSGRITSSVAGIDCGADCSQTWSHGTSVTLTATATAGSNFVGWSDASGACSGTGPCTLTIDRARSITATFEGHTPVRLNPTDRDPDIIVRDYDRLAADLAIDFGGIRSDVAVMPGSGVFYFEGHRLSDTLGPYGVGVCSGTYPLDGASVGSTDQAVGVTASGGIDFAGAYQAGFDGSDTEYYGLVVDYRGANPIVHVIVRNIDFGIGMNRAMVRRSITMTNVTTPVYILVAGRRAIVGDEIEINPGNDTTNFPFHYDPVAVLRSEGIPALAEVADHLVLGWGSTYAASPSLRPTVTVSAAQTVSNGASVTVTATAMDAEDGVLTSQIRWELLSSPHYAGRVRGTGPSFTFDADGIGIHPARAWVVDASGRVGEAVVRVTVPGPVAMQPTVRLQPDASSGAGIELNAAGTSTRYTGFGKMGIRANQSCYGCYWYFEFSRLHAPLNMGGGLVTGMGNLNPFDWSDVPQSIAINVLGGSWRNLIPEATFPVPASDVDHYGVVVDYRGEHPIVSVIVDDVMHYRVEMTDTWTELYPMLYGNPLGTPMGSYDESINFGDSPFQYDPVAILGAAGISTTGLQVGWGN